MVLRLAFLCAGVIACLGASPVMAQETKQAGMDEFYLDPTLHEMIAPRHAHRLFEESFPEKVIDSTVDVLSYDLWFDWVMALKTPTSERPDRKAESKVVMKVRFVDGGTRVTFDAVTLIIDSVFVDGERAEFLKSSSKVEITPQVPFEPNDTADITIYFANASDARGFHAYSQVEADTLGLQTPIAFTFSEPEDARRWYPCHDQPFDKALFTVHARVPTGFVVVSNGTRQDSTADTDSTSWQTWHHPMPMPTYLLCVNAAPFHRYDQEYRRADGSVVPIANYHWLADQNGQKYNAERALAPIPEMFEAFEPFFGRYPYPTYGHVTITPFSFGGMEHQSMSTINRRWLQGDVALGYAHELGHQWLGDEVSCATWADIWLNEGGASFSEALYYEFLAGVEGYMAVMNSRKERYMRRGLDEPPVYDIPIGNLFNEATTYSKSAWVYHMMRRMVGDSVYFAGLRSYLAKFRNRSAQTHDMLEHFKSEIPNVPVDWDVFFDQWLVKRGHPVLTSVLLSNTEPEAQGFRQVLTITQNQSGEDVPTAFTFPLTIRIMNEDTVVFEKKLMISEAKTTVTFYAPRGGELEIDPDGDILCQKTAFVLTSVKESESDIMLAYVGSTPHQRGTDAQLRVDAGASIRVYAIDGRLLSQTVASSEVVSIPTTSWPLGVVSIVVDHNGTQRYITMPVIN